MAQSDGGQSSGPFSPIIQAGALVLVLLLSTSLLISVLPTAAGAIGGDAVVSPGERSEDDMSDGHMQKNDMAILLIDLAPFLVVLLGVTGAIAVGSTTEGHPRPVAISVAVGILLGGVVFVMVVPGLASVQYEATSETTYANTLRKQTVNYVSQLWYKPIAALKSGLTVSVPTALGGGAIAGAIRLLRD